MDTNLGFWFTSQRLDISVRKEKERGEQNPSPLQSRMVQVGVKKDVTINFSSYRSFLNVREWWYTVCFAQCWFHHNGIGCECEKLQ